jgi:hypothetical protein
MCTPTSACQVTSAREALLLLPSSTVSGAPITLTTVECAVPHVGTTTFRGDETPLWIFDGGAGTSILFDERPAVFWSVADLARGEASSTRLPLSQRSLRTS